MEKAMPFPLKFRGLFAERLDDTKLLFDDTKWCDCGSREYLSINGRYPAMTRGRAGSLSSLAGPSNHEQGRPEHLRLTQED